ncbi:MAG: efflux RND transporter periplasmic adaptor subunit [Thermodesulfovibrionales bacterium]|jgi:cobalt-zinc-cadmium efflux system membrane fusion protein
MQLNKRTILVGAAVAVAVLAISTGIYFAKNSETSQKSGLGSGQANAAQGQAPSAQASTQIPGTANTVTLEDARLKSVKIEPVGEHLFAIEQEAVGNIAFNDDRSVQVYPPNQGKIIELFADLGDDVVKGKKLYTINSPDLIQAESTLIAAAGVLELTTHVLERAQKLYETQGIAQKDLEQATSDHQAADGALKAARNAVSIFGKTEVEIDQIVAKRRIDPLMVVPSPITGRVTARNAAPGLLAQPGTPPAPFSVADISTLWMVAYVVESDSPLFHVGQEVKVKVMAFPGRVFEGKITTVGTIVDPATHRLMVRSEIRDPKHELRPGMLATFTIRTGAPIRSIAIPVDGVVREGDGTMTAWVTNDRHRFEQRAVTLGLQKDGWYQIVKGLKPSELVVTQGGVFLSNMLQAPPSD